MLNRYRIRIITQQGIQYEGNVWSVQAHAADGYLGVRAGHAPMIAELKQGLLKVKKTEYETIVFQCSGGVLQVESEGVTILADDIERHSSEAGV